MRTLGPKILRSPLTNPPSSDVASLPYSECMTKIRYVATPARIVPDHSNRVKKLFPVPLLPNTIRSFDESSQINTHGHVHVERAAYFEVGCVFAAKHTAEIRFFGLIDRSKMRRNCFDRAHSLCNVTGQHQRRPEFNGCIGRRPCKDFLEEWVVCWLVCQDSSCSCSELDIGQHCKKFMLTARHEQELPEAKCLDLMCRIDTSGQPFGE